jgi:hypothetical protein
VKSKHTVCLCLLNICASASHNPPDNGVNDMLTSCMTKRQVKGHDTHAIWRVTAPSQNRSDSNIKTGTNFWHCHPARFRRTTRLQTTNTEHNQPHESRTKRFNTVNKWNTGTIAQKKKRSRPLSPQSFPRFTEGGHPAQKSDVFDTASLNNQQILRPNISNIEVWQWTQS